jgi:hypothetical protein
MTVSVSKVLFFGNQLQRQFFLDLIEPAPQDVRVCWGDPFPAFTQTRYRVSGHSYCE